MTSLLRPVVLESCQTTLRGRRRSSHLSLNAVPRLFSPITPASNDSAILDEPALLEISDSDYTPDSSNTSTPHSLSPLCNAHVSDYFTSTSVARQNGSAPVLYTLAPPPTKTLVRPRSKTSSTSSATDVNHRSSSELERLKWRLTSGFFAYFLCGWGDGVTGTVLPYFTADFHLNPMTSSLLFAGSTCGFFTGTILVEPVMTFLGRCAADSSTNSLIPYVPWLSKSCSRKKIHNTRHSASQARHLVLVFSSIVHASYFVMIGSRTGYPGTFMAYAVAAFSRGLLTASLNAYFASGPQQSLGYSYGLWSLGAGLSPLACQTIISSGIPWARFYFGSLVLSGINTVLLFFAFKPTASENSAEVEEATVEMSQTLSPPSSPIDEYPKHLSESSLVAVAPHRSTLRLTLSLLYHWALSIFAMMYCGSYSRLFFTQSFHCSETTTQGFMVTYLLGARHANPKTAGYVTSGFWGGITVGRFAWGYFMSVPFRTPCHHTALTFMQPAVALVMQLLIWFINSTIQNAVSASVIGALYGPLFPAILRLANDILPSEVHMISMGLISAFGSIGSAVFPFIVGAVSSVKGIQTMTYLTVPLGVVLICLWSLFPSRLPTRISLD
ncbi:major facilitator superfamily domain-containing protein [Lyophyllum atratum]|nr:major facilitator superfamily domain-containing protein [Lyophyllum atratum]